MHDNSTTMFFLNICQMLGVIGLAIATGLASLGIWNVYIARATSGGNLADDRARFLRSLRRVFLSRVGPWNLARFSRQTLSDLERKLTAAGSPGELKPEEIIGLQELSFVVFTMIGAMMWFVVAFPPWYVLPAFPLIGWYYPRIWLHDQLTKRHHRITRALPYNLDLLTLAVEAGLDFAQAVGKVVEKGRQGPLVDEFGLMLKNLRMGKTREEGLRMMAERVQLASLTSFASALIQADRMGTSLGKILRLQSTQLRIDRTHRAEKLANEAPVKMLFPLIAFIFPTVFMVLFGPIIYQALYGNQ